MAHFVKLFDSIIHSTIWQEEPHVKLTWITLLALADSNGEVQASIPGLARAAGVSISQCEDALNRFQSPDPYSRSKEEEGRRIVAIDGGWELINYRKYRALKSSEQEKENAAERQRRFRERGKTVTDVTESNTLSPKSNGIVEGEEEVEVELKEEEQERPPSAPSVPLLKVKKEKPPKKIKTTALKPECVAVFQTTWDSPPKTVRKVDKELNDWVNEPVAKGSRMQAERNFQGIVDSGVATADELCYAFQAYCLEGIGPKKGFFQHVSTFFGPEKATYLEWLERAKQIALEFA